ncbi:MAG: permease [Planctomycetota bacterium]
MDYLTLFANSLFMALAMSAPYVVLGYVAAALIKEFVSRQALATHLGDQGIRPVLNAVGIGTLLPICSCGVIPLGVGVHRAGAARGTTLAFMSSSPAISPVSILMVGMMLGPLYLATYSSVAMIGSLLIGVIGNGILRNKRISSGGRGEESPPAGLVASSTTGKLENFDDIVDQAKGDHEHPHDHHQRKADSGDSRFRRAMRWAFWELGADVSVDLTIGLSVAALVLAFLPIELTEAYLGTRSVWTLLLVILIGIPVYTCSVPTIPIVWALFMRGAMPGAMLAYMIAGPATNLGELNAIRRSMGLGTASFYAVSLIVIALAGGLIANHLVFASYEYKATMIAENELQVQECCVPMIFGNRIERNNLGQIAASVPTWHYPFILVLLITVGVGFYQRAFSRFRGGDDGHVPASPRPSEEATA